MIIKYKQRRKELYVWEEWVLRRSSFLDSEYLSCLGQLDSLGYTTTFRSGICSIADAKGQKVLGANLEDGLYILSKDGSAHISEIKMLRTTSHSHSINMW